MLWQIRGQLWNLGKYKLIRCENKTVFQTMLLHIGTLPFEKRTLKCLPHFEENRVFTSDAISLPSESGKMNCTTCLAHYSSICEQCYSKNAHEAGLLLQGCAWGRGATAAKNVTIFIKHTWCLMYYYNMLRSGNNGTSKWERGDWELRHEVQTRLSTLLPCSVTHSLVALWC